MNRSTVSNLLDDIHPLDWHGVRHTDTMAKHFVTMRLATDHQKDRKILIDWLDKNTAGRYSIGVLVEDNNNFRINYEEIIGFEDPMEATLYKLSFK